MMIKLCRNLIDKYARALATSPDMWGGCLPQQEMITMLEEKCREDWKRAVGIMLRHWETRPVYPVEEIEQQ
jgi:hypothetical protein